MPTPSIYYPKLKDLIDAQAIPGDFEGLENLANEAIDLILGNLRYKNYLVEHSPDGDTVFYSLKLLTKELKQPLFGSGMELVFFKGTTSNYSEFLIAFDWRWPIQRYIKEFDAQGFSYAPEAFVDILLEFADISDEQEFLEEIIAVFLNSTTTYENFYTELTTTYVALKAEWPAVSSDIQVILDQMATIKDEVDEQLSNNKSLLDIAKDYKNNTILKDAVDAASASFSAIAEVADVDFDIYSTFIKAVLEDITDLEQKFNQLFALFQTWLGNITKEDIEDLLIPQFGLELQNINMALEFPRKWLIPLDVTTHEPLPGKSALTFDVGNLKYSTQSGLEFEDQSNFKFAYSSIGKTGFTLSITDLKVDLSKTKNIAEADADGRPIEFTGMYCKEAVIGLPKKWFKQADNQTLAIYGRNLLIGPPGGISGSIGLEVKNTEETPQDADGELEFVLGKKDASGNRKGFALGFKKFDMEWYQNSLVQSEVEGSITIPNFKRYDKLNGVSKSTPLKINIEALFEQNGDFEITARPEDGFCICIGEDGKVLFIDILSLSVGKDDDKVFIEVSGNLDFSSNKLVNKFITTPIFIKKLRIYSDGSFEVQGGSIPIPVGVSMKLGPVEVNVTNITLASETIDDEPYKFIGFDCGVSTGSGGMDLRGDGIKVYFNGDGSKMFLRIAGIGVDLMIPGNATEETAALIVKGYLSLKKDEYAGSVAFTLPSLKLSGGAAMKMKPKVPAFAMDAFMKLPTPILLGPTGLGIFEFRGLFGLHYIADLPDGATQDPKKMFEFYTNKVGNPLNGGALEKGLHLGKIVSPDDQADGYKTSGTPISIGAGLSIGTSADSGFTFSMMAFLFLSVPEMLMISGRANVLGDRVSATADAEPPFFAYLALSKEYVSLGMGANYKQPKAQEDPDYGGDFLELDVEAQLAFFFKDASAWYVHFGTKETPNQARLLKKIFRLNAYAYVMLSAAGIHAGAGVKFDMKRKYGPVAIAVNAYVDAYAMLSFRKGQMGGGIALGGSVDIKLFGVGLYIGLAAYLMMTAPRPFIVRGGIEICVKIKIVFFKFKKCFDVDFKWTFNRAIDTSPIGLISEENTPAAGFHIGSGLPYKIDGIYTELIDIPTKVDDLTKLPLDSYIDFQFMKAIDPTAVNSIGGVTNAPVGNWERVSPKAVDGQVIHHFKMQNLKVLVHSDSGWVEYNPYKALDDTSFLDSSVNPDDLKLGYWQKKGREYNNLRVLSTHPFNYMDSMAGGIIPEQMGLTAATLFCPEKEIECHCIQWRSQKSFKANTWTNHENVLFKVTKNEGTVANFSNVFKIPTSLKIDNHSSLEIIFPEKVSKCSLKLFSFVDKVIVRFYTWETTHETLVDKESTFSIIPPKYVLAEEQLLSQVDFVIPVSYNDEEKPIKKIVVEIPCESDEELIALKNQIESLKLEILINEDGEETGESLEQQLKLLITELKTLEEKCCPSLKENTRIKDINKDVKVLKRQLARTEKKIETATKQKDVSVEKYRVLNAFYESCALSIDKDSVGYFDENPCLKKLEGDKLYEQYKTFVGSLEQLQKNRSAFEKNDRKNLHKISSRIEKRLASLQKNCDRYDSKLDALVDEQNQLRNKLEGLEMLHHELEPIDEIDTCSTYIHELCYLTEAEVIYNYSIPAKAAIEADYSAMFDANNKTIAPIWRPNEAYAIKIETLEVVSGVHYSSTKYFAFATEGPIGHFNLKNLSKDLKQKYNLDSNGVEDSPPEEAFDKRIEIPENALKFYFNYDRCYPNPNGNILNQKPMYYRNPKIRVFFNQPFVKHFFSKWPVYNGLQEKESKLEIVIKDPTENSAEVSTGNDINAKVLSQLPKTTVTWEKDEFNHTPGPISLINDLRNPKRKNREFDGHTCWQIGGDPIKPHSQKPSIKVENLLPSKLYNVVIFNDYSQDMTTYVRKQIHSFPFQTSMYSDIKDHMGSYKQKNDLGDTKDAIYDDETTKIPANKNLKGILEIALGFDEHFPVDMDQKLVETYSDVYQRIIEGYLELRDLPSPTCTEFNIMRDSNDKIIAIWMRSLEPLNDFRIPYDDIYDSIEVIRNNSSLIPVKRDLISFGNNGYLSMEGLLLYVLQLPNPIGFITVYSKDRSSALIVPYSPFKDNDDVKLKFSHLEWNGNDYDKQSYTTDELLLS